MPVTAASRTITELETAARNAHDMTVADVRETVGRLADSLAAASSKPPVRRTVVPAVVIEDLDAAYKALAELTRKHRVRRNPLPDSEYQITASGRRLRVLAVNWGDWIGDWEHVLIAVLGCCDAVLDGAKCYATGLYTAIEGAKKSLAETRSAAGSSR